MEQLRIAQGIGKVELAKRAGVARATVNRLQTQKRPPLIETVVALADVVGLDRTEAAALAGLAPGPKSADDIELDEAEQIAAEMEASLLERRGTLNDRQRRVAREWRVALERTLNELDTGQQDVS